MIRLNLLPWRERLRQKTITQFKIKAGVIVGLIIILIAIQFYSAKQQQQLQLQKQSQIKLQIQQLIAPLQEIQALRKQQAELNNRLKVFQQLQALRAKPVQLIEALSTLTPNAIYLTAVNIEGQHLTINGIAEQHSSISDFMRNIKKSPLFTEPSLQSITPAKSANQWQFRLIVGEAS